jgi:hypothetical protein
MKISKLLPVLCALAVGANSLPARAQDTPAQSAARIALAKKLFEMDAQKPPATNTAAANPVATPPKTTGDDVVMTPVGQPTAKEAKAKAKADKAAASAKAKQESDQATADLKTQQEARAKSAVEAKAQTDKATAEVKKESKQKPVTDTAPVVVAAPQPAKAADANFTGKDLGMKPIAAPALPIAASKEDRLQALLGKYKADQISPEEYHKQRAAILAEP